MVNGMLRSFCLACLGLGILALATGGFGASDQAKAPEVNLKAVSYAGLGEIIRQFKGQVVVVDFWADN